MKYLWKRATGLLLTSALVLGLAACGGTPTGNTNPPEDPGTQQTTQPVAPDSGAAGEKLVYSNGGPEEFFETPWLNPGTYVYNKAVYGHLIVADENLNPIPNHPDALATYEYSADGKTLTFTLRDDAYWHNGEKVTPEDIKWSIEFVAKTPVANAVFISTFSAIAGSKTGDTFNDTFSGIAIDGQKIIITFDKIAPDALLTFTQFAPVPKSEFEGIDPLQVQQAPFFQHPIGCGPFMVEEVNMKNYTILAPFDRYYNGVADFKIQLLPSAGDSDPNVVTRAKSGNLDYGYTKMVADVQALEGTPGITVTPIDVRYTRLFYLNKFDKKDGSPAPLADVRVRQALRYAIDMETICETLFQGSAVPANALAPDANLKGGDLNDYNYNPEKAKELLAEANWDPNTVIKAVYYYTDQATVYLIRRSSFDYSWRIAVVTGAVVYIVLMLFGSMFMSISMEMGSVIIAGVVSALIGLVIEFFVLGVDYSRSEVTQFEDDEYVYYVKAVPKSLVSQTKKSVKKFSSNKKSDDSDLDDLDEETPEQDAAPVEHVSEEDFDFEKQLEESLKDL